jgi:tripeptide aminopeptidase
MQSKTDRLVDILSTPTYFTKEDKLVVKISTILDELNIQYMVDDIGNIYVTKGKSDFYPCVVAHTDTVHELCEFEVHFTDTKKELYAKTLDDKPTGIGGDDKAGVFVCLELLREIENIKAIFLVGEEFGCYGARLAEPKFFENVGYAIEFDAPGYNWVTYTSNGVRLFDLHGDFIKIVKPILEKHMNSPIEMGIHPYTDVAVIKKNYDFSCLNISVGYYNMHTVDEYVDIEQCLNTINIATDLIKSLGDKKYHFIDQVNTKQEKVNLDNLRVKFINRKKNGF